MGAVPGAVDQLGQRPAGQPGSGSWRVKPLPTSTPRHRGRSGARRQVHAEPSSIIVFSRCTPCSAQVSGPHDAVEGDGSACVARNRSTRSARVAAGTWLTRLDHGTSGSVRRRLRSSVHHRIRQSPVTDLVDVGHGVAEVEPPQIRVGSGRTPVGSAWRRSAAPGGLDRAQTQGVLSPEGGADRQRPRGRWGTRSADVVGVGRVGWAAGPSLPPVQGVGVVVIGRTRDRLDRHARTDSHLSYQHLIRSVMAPWMAANMPACLFELLVVWPLQAADQERPPAWSPVCGGG